MRYLYANELVTEAIARSRSDERRYFQASSSRRPSLCSIESDADLSRRLHGLESSAKIQQLGFPSAQLVNQREAICRSDKCKSPYPIPVAGGTLFLRSRWSPNAMAAALLGEWSGEIGNTRKTAIATAAYSRGQHFRHILAKPWDGGQRGMDG